jgi:hypothetical protein
MLLSPFISGPSGKVDTNDVPVTPNAVISPPAHSKSLADSQTVRSEQQPQTESLDGAQKKQAPITLHRMWRDKRGRQLMRAVFVKYNDGVVTLERENQERVNMLLTEFSEVDQAWIYARFE